MTPEEILRMPIIEDKSLVDAQGHPLPEGVITVKGIRVHPDFRATYLQKLRTLCDSRKKF